MPVRVAGRTKHLLGDLPVGQLAVSGERHQGDHAGLGEAVLLGEVAVPPLPDQVPGHHQQPAERHVLEGHEFHDR